MKKELKPPMGGSMCERTVLTMLLEESGAGSKQAGAGSFNAGAGSKKAGGGTCKDGDGDSVYNIKKPQEYT